MRRILILVFMCMTMVGYAQDYPALKPLKENKLEGELVCYERKGKCGYKNLEGKVVIKAVFDAVEPFENLKDGLLVARVKCGDKWGLINRSGVWYVTPRYKSLSVFDHNIAVFEDEEGYGLLSHNGSHICKGFQRIDPFDARGYAWVMKGGSWGIINRLGLFMVKPILSDNEAVHLCETLYKVRGDGNVGVIDFKNFKFLLGLKYDDIHMLNKDLIECRNGTEISVITPKGYRVVDKCMAIEKIGSDHWKYHGEDGWGIFEATGWQILQPIYDSIEYARIEGKASYILEKDKKYGLAALDGEKIIPVILETNQFKHSDFKGYYEYWSEGNPCGIKSNGNGYRCNVTMSSLDWARYNTSAFEVKILKECTNSEGDSFYVELNRSKEFIDREGFDEYSWARKISELIAPNSEGELIKVGVWLDKILKSLNVDKMAEFYARKFRYPLSEAYADLEKSHIEIELLYNEALFDGNSLFVADLGIDGYHIQRFVSILNQAGTAIASIKLDGEVYNNSSGYDVDDMEVSVCDDYIIFTYRKFGEGFRHCDVYSENLKLLFSARDIEIKELVSEENAYYFVGREINAVADALYMVKKADLKLEKLQNNFEGLLGASNEVLFLDKNFRRFFVYGNEKDLISSVAFKLFEWDGRKSVMMYIMNSTRKIDYDSWTEVAGEKIFLPGPSIDGLSVYKWQKFAGDKLLKYGLWSESDNSFTLPLFESLEVGDVVKYTISGKEFTSSLDAFWRKYKASVKMNYSLDKNEVPVNSGLDYYGFEEEVVEEETIPFQLVEEKPSFNGGDANMFSKWVNERLVYPEIAKQNGVQGRVTLQFTVEKDGRVTKVKVIRGVDPSLDKEAVRVVSMSPKWKPGKQRDRAVPVTYTFPVIFQLR